MVVLVIRITPVSVLRKCYQTRRVCSSISSLKGFFLGYPDQCRVFTVAERLLFFTDLDFMAM